MNVERAKRKKPIKCSCVNGFVKTTKLIIIDSIFLKLLTISAFVAPKVLIRSKIKSVEAYPRVEKEAVQYTTSGYSCAYTSAGINELFITRVMKAETEPKRLAKVITSAGEQFRAWKKLFSS
mmetsp:Transcript_4465/g.5182  ORF Transcript_4465/g.5182 Transcript_4465/m.5182 type:complete len:122 (+) Transcript_4465:1077-1442(+)